jgi:hypothetical protein
VMLFVGLCGRKRGILLLRSRLVGWSVLSGTVGETHCGVLSCACPLFVQYPLCYLCVRFVSASYIQDRCITHLITIHALYLLVAQYNSQLVTL